MESLVLGIILSLCMFISVVATTTTSITITMVKNGQASNNAESPTQTISEFSKKAAAEENPVSFKLCEEESSLFWKTSGTVYNQGPDQLLPSSAPYTWHANGAVRTSKLASGEAAKRAAISVPTLLEAAERKSPHRMAIAMKRNGSWSKWTYREYAKDVRTAAKGFIALGLQPHHSVCILGFNAPEWFISDLAAIYAGGFAVGMYTTSSPEACLYVAQDSKANIIVVEDDAQLEKILSCRDKLADVTAIIQYTGQPKEPTVYSWNEFMLLGEQQTEEVLTSRLKSIAVNQCCTLVYTSGTTGSPKGVMLSHDNLTWAAHVNCATLKLADGEEEYISFLPLSHVAAQIYDLYCALTVCASIYIADRNALKGSLFEMMTEVKPTFFMAVPRVWEKLYEKMADIDRRSSWLAKIVNMWASSVGLQYSLKRMSGVENPATLAFRIANKWVFSRVKNSVGLNRCRVHLSGCAPIKPDILKYFMSLNIIVTEVYGLSECTGPHITGLERATKLGSVGKTMPGMRTKINYESDDDHNNRLGELCVGGRHVHMGYLNQPEKTRESMDSTKGWLLSGDVGQVDKDGFVFVTGRIKEILITSGGEKVYPIPIENHVKSALPIVSQAMLVGDKLKFLSVFLTLKTEVDKDTLQILNTLQSFTKGWISVHGDCDVNTVEDVLTELNVNKNKMLISAFQNAIDQVNSQAPSRAQQIRKWRVLPIDFSVAGGELGPTLKLKRPSVVEKYKAIIYEVYGNVHYL